MVISSSDEKVRKSFQFPTIKYTVPRTLTSVLKTWSIKISMDGKGRFRDNIFVERLWRTLKYERIYLNVYETGAELSKDMTYWFNWYNVTRKHSSLDKLTPDEAYYQGLGKLKLAA